MGKGKILITDSLFISKENEREIKKAGFTIERIGNPAGNEAELCKAIKGKVGYILGGTESVNKKVLDSANKLKAISFTGSGYKEFIPGYRFAKKRDVLISNAPGGNADAVAEYTLSLILMMNRELLALGITGNPKYSFNTVTSLKNKTIGIIGLGRIGLLVCKYLKAMGVKDILYFSKHRKVEFEVGFGAELVSKGDIMDRSDIISIHVSKDVGDGFINADDLKLMRKNSILINTSFPEVVDLKSMYQLIKEEKIKVAFDKPPHNNIPNFPTSDFYYSKSQTGYNTREAIKTVSDMVTKSIINLLTKRDDIFCVNK